MPRVFLLTHRRYREISSYKPATPSTAYTEEPLFRDQTETVKLPEIRQRSPGSLSTDDGDSDSGCSLQNEYRVDVSSDVECGLECKEHISFLFDLMSQSPRKNTCRDAIDQPITSSQSYQCLTTSNLITSLSQFSPLNDLINTSVSTPRSVIDEHQENHVCYDCGKRYSTSSNLARHRQTHRSVNDKKARKCPHCEKVYVSMPAYSMHVRTHNQGCECPYCGKRFSRPWLLQGHVRTHTGEKPFACPTCRKPFADKSNLRAHIQTHSTDKPYVCGRCGKAFALKSYLYKHEESSCMRGQRFRH